MRTVEGKDPIPIEAYKHLARILLASVNPEWSKAHLFLLLDWNLISRAKNVMQINIDLVTATDDALVFLPGPTKGDQDGIKNQGCPWYVYSNPTNPEICAHLAFCKHLINNPPILNGQNKLFGGSSQYDRINNILWKIVNDPQHIQVFQRLKLPAQYFGTHSIRKGAASFVACGIISCPPITSICIRANWKMPGVE
jgi:hypothetical protein